MTGQQGATTLWSGLETKGMKEAKCSLLLQEDAAFEPKIKALPKQRVLVYQDKGFHPNNMNASANSNINSNSNNGNSNSNNHAPNSNEDNFYVDFKGCTILQLEPSFGPTPQRTMPVTLTVGGRCIFTPENYHDFRVMMRTKEQSREMDIAPNGNFDWPDVQSMLLCPLCGSKAPIPQERDEYELEYWMLFYPLLQITVMKGSQMTLGTRTVCRLTCLECMENLLEGMLLTVQPGSSSNLAKNTRLSFTLPASNVLAEAGSASFLEDGPPRPETHPHVDDILDAWTLYNLWEHSGAWEALQNDYRIVLSRSMQGDAGGPGGTEEEAAAAAAAAADGGDGQAGSSALQPRLRERLGKACGNSKCKKVQGKKDRTSGEIIRLTIKCKECFSEFYCSKTCREKAQEKHRPDCLAKQQERKERREKKAKKVQCDTCQQKLPYTQMKKCSRCRQATYCSVECQRKAWAEHKAHCVKRG
jgi:MYND finger